MCSFWWCWLTVAAAWCLAGGAGAAAGLGAAPRGCRWLKALSPEAEVSVRLDCSVQTAAGLGIALAELAPTQVGKIDTLGFVCTDALFESSLRVDTGDLLGRLRRLKTLTIDNCKIRYVPAAFLSPLRDLTELALRSDGNERSQISVEFHAESFRGLSELRSLDLGGNDIRALPSGVFCPLFSLESLNLTSNRLQDISEIGFSDWGEGPAAPGRSCNTGLKTLDLSKNGIASLPDNGFSALRSLEMLNLRSNIISKLGDRAFVGLAALDELDASDNKLEDLPPDLFTPTRQIRRIVLSNNTLKSMAPGVLQGLDRLQFLDLSRNELTHSYINRDTFAGLVRLEILDLSNNKISRLDPKLFQDLRSLRELYLVGNSIETLIGGAFADLAELRLLSMTRNRLRVIDEFHFSSLYALKELYLDENYIDYVHVRAFENMTNLQTLILNGNALRVVPESVKKLRSLKYLDLGKNDIDRLDGEAFDGLQELYGLRMVDNNIVNITKDAFASLPSLRILNLASNKIERIDAGAFESNIVLKVIKLDENRLTDVTGAFDKLPTLGWLNLSNNRLTQLDYGHFPDSLEWLDAHKNAITKIENAQGVSSSNLRTLNFSFNLLTKIDDLCVPDDAEDIYFDNNNIMTVEPRTFSANANLKKVVLVGNRLKSVDVSAFALPPIPHDRELPQFYIAENPFLCDCTMEWVQKISQWNHVRQYPRFADLESVTCRPVRGNGGTKPLADLPGSQFLCPYESHCSSKCNCCDFEACDCEMTCPDRCSCYHDNGWSSNVIDCSNAGYKSVPTKIPMDATEIYLDGNDFGSLGNHIFIGKKKVRVLYLNNSNIESIESDAFNGLSSLEILHLDNNRISELKGQELNQTKLLKQLYLDRNAISRIDENSFAYATSLKTLHLEHNKMVDLNPKVFAARIPSLVSLFVEGNTWSCDCDSLFKLERWFKTTKENVKKMYCANSANVTVSEAIAKCDKQMRDNVVSSENQPSAFKESEVAQVNYVPFLAIVLISVILVLLLGALVFAFRQDVRLWAHSKYGVRIFKNNSIGDCELDKDRMYDGYMVYSVLDDDFVSRVVSPELEQSGYSMCLHYRDLQISSDDYLSDALINATEASKRLILIISFSFLQNEWSRPNFKRCMKATIESIPPSLRRHKVVFILTTDVSALNLDADLQTFFKICTVILWGEKRFWEKIRYSMPDIANLQWNKTPSKSGNQMMPNGRRSVSRYTASPTSLDQWYKYAALPPQPAPTTIPTPGDDASLLTSTTMASQPYDIDPLNHSYVSIDTHYYERSRRDMKPPLDEQGYLRPRPAPPIC